MEVIIQLVSVRIRIIHLKKRYNTWVIKEGNVVSPTIIIIRIIRLKNGEAIKIKVLGGNTQLENC